MRVIAGRYRSLSIEAPRGWKTRPTSDRLRETLFDVLGTRVSGGVFADLFAGTGAVGIEALSRGARQAWFAEMARPALAALRGNLERLGIGTAAQVDPAGTLPLLRRLVKSGIQLDTVFLDPPYSEWEAYQETLGFLGGQPLLPPGAIVVAEHARRTPLQNRYAMLDFYRLIEQGEAALSFFRARPHPAAVAIPDKGIQG